jgi:hypothetical protein
MAFLASAFEILAHVGCSAVLLTLACGESTSDPLETGVTGVSTGSSGGSTTTGADESDATSAADDGPVLDVAATGEGGPVEGCQKVDFVFAIDNSSSMIEEQDQMIGVFPQFIDTIMQNVAGQDYHIMVLDSDANPTDAYCAVPGEWACGPGNLCDPFVCGSWDSLGLDACDETLGAGVRGPYGGSASNVDCGIPADRRYLIEGDPNISDTFSCIAQLGETGSLQERPISAMLEALGPLQGPGQCNEGFLRDDAILVLTVISDDPATGTADDAQQGANQAIAWHDAFVALNGGNDDAIVAVGVVPLGDGGISGMCDPLQPPHPFRSLVESFGARGVMGSICDLEFASTFDEAVGIISDACDEFVPPG